MNIFKRAILAGRVAANRAWKKTRGVFARYEGGRRWQYGDRSYIWSYVTDARFDANQATRIELVRKARYFEQNCALVQRLADLWEQYTVGVNGLVLSPDSDDEEWNIAASEWFDEWGMYPDLVTLQNWATLQSLISRTWFIDGEIFIIKTRGETPPFRPRIQLIEGHRVGTPPGMLGQEGQAIIDGVQIDKKGRPTAYWVQSGISAENYISVPAENMIHVFEPSRPGMYRGLTHFYAVMNPLHDLDDLERLEMQVAKELAKWDRIIKRPQGEMANDAQEWDKQTQSADQSSGLNPATQYYKREFGASTKVMFSQDEIEQQIPQRPSVAQQWYWDYLAEKVCTGSAGIPLILVYPDKAQGTVYRGALDMAAGTFRCRSALLSTAAKAVWTYVIGSGSNQDRRIANKPVDWTSLIARYPRAVNVDVGRNSNAMLAELAAGTRTWQDIYAETGDDWKQKLRQRAREVAFIKKLGKEFDVEPGQITDALENQIQQNPQNGGK